MNSIFHKMLPCFAALTAVSAFAQTPPADWKAKEPKTDASANGLGSKPKLVNWNYLRQNRPEVVQAFIQDVKAGKLRRSAIAGLGNTELVDSMVAKTPIRATRMLHVSKTQELKLAKFTEHPLIAEEVPDKNPLKYVDLTGVVIKHTFDEGSQDLGSSPMHGYLTYSFTGVIPAEGDVTLSTKGYFWVREIDTLSGELVKQADGTLAESTENALRNDEHESSPLKIHVRAGQSVRIIVAASAELHPLGAAPIRQRPGIRKGEWTLDCSSVQYHGSVSGELFDDKVGMSVASSTGSVTFIQGGTAYLAVNLSNLTPNVKHIALVGNELPAGVSMDGQTVTLNPNETRKVNLHFTVAGDAPDSPSQWMTVAANPDGGTPSVRAGLNASVYLPFYSWPMAASAGKVDAQASLTIGANGMWHWSGMMHDRSTWYGDDYVYTFWFTQPSAEGKHLGFQVDGVLGAKHSGPATHQAFDASGMNQDIADHFGSYASQGSPFGYDLHVTGDIGSALGQVANWLRDHAIDIAELAMAA
jgi:hypothetical protein